jgi:C-terminal processing protease CtpA/Prc
MRRFPLQLRWFDDALYVVGADVAAARAIGLRLVSVGNTEIKEAAEMMGVYLPYGNRWDKREHEAALLVISDLLHASGILDSRDSGRFTFMKSDGSKLTLDLMPSIWIEWVPRSATPLYLKSPDVYFWMKHLEETRILWIRINICTNAEDFAEFTRDAMALIDHELVDTIVIDWRGNSGGNSLAFRPMLEGLKKRVKTSNLRLYGVIDHGTYSSALINALNFKRELPATLLGEPTGDKIGDQGEVRSFVLPNSKLTIQYTARFFDFAGADMEALMPDILISPGLNDILKGLDPVYEAIISGKL